MVGINYWDKTMKKTPLFSILQDLILFSRPWMQLAVTLFYLLGLGVCRYLSISIDVGTAILGWATSLLLIISSGYLKIYFDYPVGTLMIKRENAFQIPRNSVLTAAISLLTAGALLSIVLALRGAISPIVLLFLGLGFGISYFWGTPPLRLITSGYGEVLAGLLVVNITPALGFALQTAKFHPLLAMLTFPLTALWVAMVLALGLEHYWQDVESGRRVLLVRLGWERGMQLHNILLLVAYLLILSARGLGLSWPLAWPGLLTFPLMLFQIWQMRQIRLGSKPRWPLLRFTAVATTMLTAYFITYALWTV